MTESLKDYPYCILIVDDENRDWANPMREALEDEAEETGYSKISIEIAHDLDTAKNKLAQKLFHIVSLDMRISENFGETVTFETGVKLAKSFSFIGFPKGFIYSQTLRDLKIKTTTNEVIAVLQISMDSYAKPTGSEADNESRAVETLTVRAWAKRVVDYLNPDLLTLTEPKKNNALLPEYQTLLGAYLHCGSAFLPPILARQLQDLQNAWHTKDARRNDTAIKFIEGVARLALAQCAVLSKEPSAKLLPEDERMSSCLTKLQGILPSVSGYNFSNYLTQDAVKVFRQTLKDRNQERHALTVNNPAQFWADLRIPLQYAMDVAAYWIRHPLCLNLSCSRDGWNAELLAGIATPRRRYSLPQTINFPNHAINDSHIWQNVWRIDTPTPQPKELNWDGWLIPDSRSEYPWWLLIHKDNYHNKHVYLDLNSGNTKML